jgi:hypothetical protein
VTALGMVSHFSDWAISIGDLDPVPANSRHEPGPH